MCKRLNFIVLTAAALLLGLPTYFLAARPSVGEQPSVSNTDAPPHAAVAPVKAINWSSFAPVPATAPLAPATVPGANGKIAFASRRDGNDEIYVMDADGANPARITFHPACDVGPVWSPDGARLAFTSRRDGNFEIYSMNADGTNVRRLTDSDEHSGFPNWSPDGTKIVFMRGDLFDPSSPEIYVMNADGSNQVRLTNNDEIEAVPAWSPNGARIAFISGSIFDPDSFEIYAMNADGTNRTRLTNNSVADVQPAWSLDGAKLVFASSAISEPAGAEIFTMNADGTGRTQLTNNNVTDAFPAWSPDGTKIVYASGDVSDERGVELHVMSASGGNQMRLTNNSHLDWFPDWQTVSSVPPTSTIAFSAATYQANETSESATISVQRSGDTSAAATVDYSTIDDPAPVRCDAISVVSPGTAYARCDYATTIDTLAFAAGQTQASFNIPLINDAHLEPPETVRLRLSNPSGASLGANSAATLIINSDETGSTVPNPILASPFFVRMQYLDFLSREPEPAGFQDWLNVLNNCSDVNNNPECDRITVSSSFFRSEEFQLKGYFVYLFYRVSLNRRPLYEEIIPDMRSVTGQTPAELFQKRAAFANAWVARPEFSATYDTVPDDMFVFTLLSRYNLSAITTIDPANPDGTQFVTLTLNELISRLSAGTLTRATVLRAIVQSREVDRAEFNGAFVAMQYYGYLRRTPEEAGYQDWLRHLNANPTDFRTMVNGFMNSTEYRLRFGRP